MPIWITECNDKFIVDLIAELNMTEEATSVASSLQAQASHTHLVLYTAV